MDCVLLTEYGISRDGYGRPKLYPPTGGNKVSYTRVSTAAKWLDDKGGLINWSSSMAMIGLMKSKPLQARMSAIIARSNDPYRENKSALKELVFNATQVAQASGRADFGTAFHEMSELLDAGTLDWMYVPEILKGPLEAYRETMRGVTVLDSEVFVAIDQDLNKKKLRLAGSFDRLLNHPVFGVVVADVKTGTDEPKYPLGVTAQVALYSRGLRYRDGEFPGAPKFPDGDANPDETAWRKSIHPDLNPLTGILIHCPLERVGGEFRCDLYALDLTAGWDTVTLGHRVQSARRPKALVRL